MGDGADEEERRATRLDGGEGHGGSLTLAGPQLHTIYLFLFILLYASREEALIPRDLHTLRTVDFFRRGLHAGVAAGFFCSALATILVRSTYSLGMRVKNESKINKIKNR